MSQRVLSGSDIVSSAGSFTIESMSIGLAVDLRTHALADNDLVHMASSLDVLAVRVAVKWVQMENVEQRQSLPSQGRAVLAFRSQD